MSCPNFQKGRQSDLIISNFIKLFCFFVLGNFQQRNYWKNCSFVWSIQASKTAISWRKREINCSSSSSHMSWLQMSCTSLISLIIRYFSKQKSLIYYSDYNQVRLHTVNKDSLVCSFPFLSALRFCPKIGCLLLDMCVLDGHIIMSHAWHTENRTRLWKKW